MWSVFVALGVVFLLLAVGLAIPRLRRAWLWETTRAEIVGLERKRQERQVGEVIECRSVYHPRVRFCDTKGAMHEIVLDLGNATYCPCDDPTGRHYRLRYDPAAPSQAIEWEPLIVWFPPAAAVVAGLASLITAAFLP